ncbi:hypothetical protein [Nitratireductor basaltis]|uniref:Uncharacterized protein n=1 Tax=Nitratireductor basaltis TaxID=472175 RepID=A0A084U987_9HYPH|nr:hypothetical protein [Nitratireductor basaltis]KFB09523.1 hypothetical protein EL18_00539 [Nitratireductor basaltis]
MSKSGSNTRGIFDTTDMDELSRVVDAVCSELGIEATDAKQRERVARRMLASWEAGRRTPLVLVQAGLDGALCQKTA